MFDAILIDDDPWVRSYWESKGQEHAKKFATAESLAGLEGIITSVSKEVPIFVDVELGPSQCGFEVANSLHNRRFGFIFLATAHESIDLRKVPFIKGIITKDPPSWLLSLVKRSERLSNEERKVLLESMQADQRTIFENRMLVYENAVYGIDGSTWLDGIGTHYPEEVFDVWERAIYEGCTDDELKSRIQTAWHHSNRMSF